MRGGEGQFGGGMLTSVIGMWASKWSSGPEELLRGSLDCNRLSSRNQMDGMTVLRYRKTMGENLKEDHQKRGMDFGKGEVLVYLLCHPLKTKDPTTTTTRKSISDRQLFSSYMQILLDSAKPSRGANFKVRLGEKRKTPEESWCLGMFGPRVPKSYSFSMKHSSVLKEGWQ